MAREQLIKFRKGTGAPSAGAFEVGEPGWDETGGRFYVKKASGSMVRPGQDGPKALTILSPSNSEKVPLFFTAQELTFLEIRSIVLGSTPSVTFSIRYGTDVSGAGTEVVTSGITVTNTTTGASTTSFNNGTVAANSWIWLTTSATSGTVVALNVSLVF
jgi:hypothetical protein